MSRPEQITLHLAAPTEQVTASPAERTISGLAVPYGPVGHSSAGAITFAQGSLSWSSVGRTKLLSQHDPERVIGYATDLQDRPDGLWATFAIPESPEGDKALQEAADGRRDGLSVGVLLDQSTLDTIVDKWVDGDDSPTAASGELLEVSQVSIPAFRDARIDGSAAAALQAEQFITLSVAFPGGAEEAPTSAHQKEQSMPVETPVSASAEPEVQTPAPAPVAVAGAAVVASESPVYTFDGRGPSFVRDIFHARFSLDREAQDRLARFNAMMTSDASQIGLVTAAVETRSTLGDYINQGYRPDMLIGAIDQGRPLTSRIGTVTLSDATPFRLPTEGEFTGVGNHTEGQAHAAEGDLTAGDVLFTPGAVSGAYRISRELVDAANPALDAIAVRAMARDYRKVTEAKVVAALLAADGTATLNINTVMELRAEINAFYDANLESPSFVAASTAYYATLLADVDTTGRPMLASIGSMNAAGSAPGWTGAHVDGVEVMKAYAVATNDAFLVNAQDVLIGESPLQTFRFDEVEGPGVIKLALWAYFGAAVTRASGVSQITSAAS